MAKKKTKKKSKTIKTKVKRKTRGKQKKKKTPLNPEDFATLQEFNDAIAGQITAPIANNIGMPSADIIPDEVFDLSKSKDYSNLIKQDREAFAEALAVVGKERKQTAAMRLALLFFTDDKAAVQLANKILPTLKSIETKIEGNDRFVLVINSGDKTILDSSASQEIPVTDPIALDEADDEEG